VRTWDNRREKEGTRTQGQETGETGLEIYNIVKCFATKKQVKRQKPNKSRVGIDVALSYME